MPKRDPPLYQIHDKGTHFYTKRSEKVHIKINRLMRILHISIMMLGNGYYNYANLKLY